MEKTVLKTLIYADIFDYPLKAWEIHKWLIGKTATLQQTEKSLNRLLKKGKVQTNKGFFYLKGKDSLVRKRDQREKQSIKFLTRAKLLAQVLKFIPSLKLVGISGGLALNNASKSDDIDLFLITSKGRIWLTRILVIFMLELFFIRRKAKMGKIKAAGKICTNILLEEDRLLQINQDLYTSHEVLQMKVLWQKQEIYKKFLEDNEWVFKFLPNWMISAPSLREGKRRSNLLNNKIAAPFGLAMTMETLAKWFQLKIMNKPKGMERIEEGALYFHPNDIRGSVLKEFHQKIKKI